MPGSDSAVVAVRRVWPGWLIWPRYTSPRYAWLSDHIRPQHVVFRWAPAACGFPLTFSKEVPHTSPIGWNRDAARKCRRPSRASCSSTVATPYNENGSQTHWVTRHSYKVKRSSCSKLRRRPLGPRTLPPPNHPPLLPRSQSPGPGMPVSSAPCCVTSHPRSPHGHLVSCGFGRHRSWRRCHVPRR